MKARQFAACGGAIGLFLLLACCLPALATDADKDPSISHATLLLPHATSETKISYTIEAFNGCFKWSSLNPEIVSIKAIYANEEVRNKECASYASITPEIMSTERLSTWVKAYDSESGRTLRCEVFLDTVHNISISTTTHTMYRAAVEELSIDAFDASNNHFTSVEGFRFDWTLTPSPSHVLQIVPFKGAAVDVRNVVLEMEEKNLRTSRVLVKGIDFGKVTVTASLSEAGYGRISDTVELSVLEPLQLSPKLPIFIAPGAEYRYILQSYPRDRDPTDIDMPNTKYQWSTDNARVATVDNLGTVRGMDLGQTKIHVRYENINEATGTVNVVAPSKLGLRLYAETDKQEIISTTSSWYLIANTTYTLEVDVYDAHDRRLHNTENMVFAVTLPREHFSVEQSSQNKAQHTIRALKEGSTVIGAELSSIKAAGRHSFKVPAVRKDVAIQSAVLATPREVRLPWHEGTPHTYALKATGGSDKYIWLSLDQSVVAASPSGVLTVHSLGDATVRVSDKKNPLNYDHVKVSVLAVGKIGIVASTVEVQVGWPLVLPAAVWDNSGVLFDNCSALPIEWESSDATVFTKQASGVSDLPPNSCTGQEFFALGEGQCTITIKYGRFTNQVTVFAYRPLKVVSPEKDALVALGSTAQIVFEGGPKPWLYEPTAFYTSVVPLEPEMVRVTPNPQGLGIARYSYSVTCLKLGDVKLAIEVSNKPTKTNQHPALANATIDFSCQTPQTVFAFADYTPANQTDFEERKQQCLGALKQTPPFEMVVGEASNLFEEFIVKGNRKVPITVAMINKDRKRFDDFSSLVLTWESSDETLASFLPSSSVSTRVLHIKADSGDVNIRVGVLGYNEQAIKEASPTIAAPVLDKQALSRSFTLKIRSNVEVNPTNVAIFNDDSNTVELVASRGSGIYSYTSNNTNAATIHPSGNASRASISPKRPGIAQVTVSDICLEDSTPATSIVTISEVGTIILAARDMLRINDEMEVQVEIRDQSGNKFPVEQLGRMDLSAHTDNDIISVEKRDGRFLVRGNGLGIARITVTARTKNGRTITSQPKAIHVFPPLHIRPERLVLLPGGAYQIKWSGGPPVRVEVAFSVDNTSVCEVDAAGRVVAREVGSTTLVASAQATDEQGNRHDYGSTVIDVTVRPLSGIRIHSNTNRLIVGTEMTVRVIGPDGETPFTLGAVGIAFGWESSDPSVAAMVPIYKEAGVSLEKEHGFSVRVQAKKAGIARISVSADGTEAWAATLQVEVVDGLVLFTPAELLLTHSSRFNIRTNKDATGKLHYRLLSEQPTPADCHQIIAIGHAALEHMTTNTAVNQLATIEERGDGLLITGNSSGEAYILISDDSEHQSVVVKVVVKPVHQLQLLPASVIYDQLPVGALMDFNIILRDNEGRAFSSTGNFEFSYDLDVINIINVSPGKTNESIQVEALRPGEAILRVFTNSRSIPLDDYVKFHVGHGITPPEPVLHKGGSIHFELTSKPEGSGGGLWSSEDERVLSVHHQSGVATARNIGKTHVFYNSTGVHTFTEVTVEQVGKVVVKTEGSPQVTNVKNPVTGEVEEYRFGVTYYTAGNKQLKSSARVKHNIFLSCSVVETEWATASSVQDLATGQDFCVIHPRTPASLKIRFIDSIHLIVRVSDAKQTYNFTHTEAIEYLPAFIVVTPTTITIPIGSKSARLEVRTKANIHLRSSDERISAKRISTDPNTDKMVYEITAEDTRKELQNVMITLDNPYTGQQEHVTVNYGETALVTTSKRDTDQAAHRFSYLPEAVVLPLLTTGALTALAGLVWVALWIARRLRPAPATYPAVPTASGAFQTPGPLPLGQQTPGPTPGSAYPQTPGAYLQSPFQSLSPGSSYTHSLNSPLRPVAPRRRAAFSPVDSPFLDGRT